MKDRVAIVTGAATGIGKAIAKRLVREQYALLLADVDSDNLERVVSECGDDARAFVCDLAEPESPAGVVTAAVEAFGRIDALVNNAAYIPRSNIETTTLEIFDRVIAINVRAPMLLIQAALPHLATTGGSVLNIGSINAYAGEPNMMAYSVSKGALMTLTRNLGDSLNREYGVRVNQINPGWTLTENEIRYRMEQGMPADWPTRLSKDYNPSGTLVSPETIAEAAVFWVGEISKPVSAAVVEMEQFPVIGRNPEKSVSQ